MQYKSYNISLYPFYNTVYHYVYFIHGLVLHILILVVFIIREVHSCCNGTGHYLCGVGGGGVGERFLF